VSVQLQGLLDIVQVGKKNLACREYVKQFNVKFRVKSSRKERGVAQKLLKSSLGGKAVKLRVVKQMMHKKHLASSKGHEDDYFATNFRRRRKFGWLWKGRLLADEESSSDEADEGDELPNLTSVGQPPKETVECKPFEYTALEESAPCGMGKTQEKDIVQRKAMEEKFEGQGPVKVVRSRGNVSLSPSPWCSAAASYTSKATRRRINGTPKLWRSPSPTLLTEKQHAAFQSRKLKEINNVRKTNLVKCLQKDFVGEVSVKKDDFVSEVSVKKDGIGFLTSADNWMEIGAGLGALLAEINCTVERKEKDCSDSECEEYFSDP